MARPNRFAIRPTRSGPTALGHARPHTTPPATPKTTVRSFNNGHTSHRLIAGRSEPITTAPRHHECVLSDPGAVDARAHDSSKGHRPAVVGETSDRSPPSDAASTSAAHCLSDVLAGEALAVTMYALAAAGSSAWHARPASQARDADATGSSAACVRRPLTGDLRKPGTSRRHRFEGEMSPVVQPGDGDLGFLLDPMRRSAEAEPRPYSSASLPRMCRSFPLRDGF